MEITVKTSPLLNIFVHKLFNFTTSAKDLYNDFNVYCRELAPGTISLTGERAQGDDSTVE